MSFDKCKYPCNLPPHSRYRTFPAPPNISSCLLQPLPQTTADLLPATVDSFCFFRNSIGMEAHSVGSLVSHFFNAAQCFCDSSMLLHVLRTHSVLFLRNIPLFGYANSLFDHSPVRRLGCFQFGAIIKQTAMNICEQVSRVDVGFHLYWVNMQELFGKCMFTLVRNGPAVFQSSFTILHSQQCTRGSSFIYYM